MGVSPPSPFRLAPNTPRRSPRVDHAPPITSLRGRSSRAAWPTPGEGRAAATSPACREVLWAARSPGRTTACLRSCGGEGADRLSTRTQLAPDPIKRVQGSFSVRPPATVTPFAKGTLVPFREAAAVFTTAWTASPQLPAVGFTANWSQEGFWRQTLRQVVRIGAGGGRVRIRLSNAYGTSPLRIAGATVARAGEGPVSSPAHCGGSPSRGPGASRSRRADRSPATPPNSWWRPWSP